MLLFKWTVSTPAITAPMAAGLLLIVFVTVVVLGGILWYDYVRPDRNEINY